MKYGIDTQLVIQREYIQVHYSLTAGGIIDKEFTTAFLGSIRGRLMLIEN